MPPSIRGDVEGFSPGSRKRLFDWLNSIDWKRVEREGLPLFFTCTYGQSWPDGRECKEHLRRFYQRLVRLHPGIGCLWRMEPQERGAPHFHMMLFGVTFIDKGTIQALWADSITREYWDQNRAEARAPFTRIESIRSVRGVKWYVGKYIAKAAKSTGSQDGTMTEEEARPGLRAAAGRATGFNSVTYLHADGTQWKWQGRVWGVMGRRFVPRCEGESLYLERSPGTWLWALRLLAAYDGGRGPDKLPTGPESMHKGFTLYFNDDKPREWWERRIELLLAIHRQWVTEGRPEVVGARSYRIEGHESDGSLIVGEDPQPDFDPMALLHEMERRLADDK